MPQDWYFDGQLLKSKYDHTCLDYNYGTGNVYMQPCHGEANQQWYFEQLALKSMYDGDLCLTISKGNAEMAKCDGKGRVQRWQWEPRVPTFKLMTEADSLCLNYNTAQGRVAMNECNDGTEQKWYFDGDNCVGAGEEKVCTGALKTKFDNKCLDFSESYDDTEDSVFWGDLLMLECDGSASQQWFIEKSTKALKTLYANRCLDYMVGTKRVFMYDCHGKSNQQWYCSGGKCRTM